MSNEILIEYGHPVHNDVIHSINKIHYDLFSYSTVDSKNEIEVVIDLSSNGKEIITKATIKNTDISFKMAIGGEINDDSVTELISQSKINCLMRIPPIDWKNIKFIVNKNG